MEERFVLDNNDNVIDFEEKTDKYCLSQDDVCNLLNKQQQRIAELEKELAEPKEKAIVPRFKIGQRIWHLLCNNGSSCVVTEDVITNIEDGIYSLKKCRFCAIEEDLFATEQEAQAKLKEIQGNG